jgi:hypothetical protein
VIDEHVMRSIMLPVQRRLILDILCRTATAVDRLPTLWPLGRDDVARTAATLEAGGAIALQWDTLVPGRRVAVLTPLGRRLRAGLNDNAMRAAIAAPRDVSPAASR